ncbi:hypothetical protein A2634_05560 [Candidatus Amesbacteria bacterium RIFCSPHIGHO2_01_FULL_48_32]|uniref:Uncharacterized protein n=1 Tax=Candidatus Amesbacteria bacterium RIFCSPLOWO2_01_FULL_48_25 TaxID=1797259 RepID=A0A1F4ZBX7_9BACT|nr:MAG: hypothetical protein A2634_05560 [Candidatus Amesbacteria bacterium RIFCSPHIGHO2_01_FULL_48_32]OGD03406.1 MAG: hypothetical protein A2989_01065 [Candidatus Amesbacteria bacterium RIFCSPLOWO2_01_FULL_48_25]HJZ05022.1 hypothetical protein [Patescibacteria group bacterium]
MPKFLSEKVTGYLLLITGLLTIGLSSFSIYQVFTKKAKPVELFNSPGISIDLSQAVYSQTGVKPKEAVKTEIMSAETINTISNISFHYFLMSFLVMVGFKLSTLGIQLLRPINVEVKSKIT